jgi:hypothetical protein
VGLRVSDLWFFSCFLDTRSDNNHCDL